VDRGRGDDQQPEQGQQQQQRDREPGGQPLLERVAEQEADEAALLVTWGGALDHVDDAEHAEGERQPADRQPASTALAVGVAQHPPGTQGQQRRQQQGALAEDRGERLVDALPGATGVPPGAPGGHHGERQQQQAEPVAPVRGVEVTGPAADRPAG
jgi:hypothetical protein